MSPLRYLIYNEGAITKFFYGNNAREHFSHFLGPRRSVPGMSLLGGKHGNIFDYDNNSGVMPNPRRR